MSGVDVKYSTYNPAAAVDSPPRRKQLFPDPAPPMGPQNGLQLLATQAHVRDCNQVFLDYLATELLSNDPMRGDTIMTKEEAAAAAIVREAKGVFMGECTITMLKEKMVSVDTDRYMSNLIIL